MTVGGNLRSGSGSSGGRTPGRIRMEMSVPKGGAIGRGNMPSESPRNVPTMPDIPEPSDVPTSAAEPGDASPPSPLS
ncbi:hypothetical protein D3C78_1910460 [compost metagenome]